MQSNKPCRTAHRPHRGNARVCPHSGAAPGRWQAGTPGRGGACRSPSKAVWTMLPCAHAVFSIYIFKSFKYFEKEILKERMPSSPSPQSHNQAPWASHPVTSSTGGGCRQDVTHLVPRICFCSSSQACVCSPVPGLPAGGASGRGGTEQDPWESLWQRPCGRGLSTHLEAEALHPKRASQPQSPAVRTR